MERLQTHFIIIEFWVVFYNYVDSQKNSKFLYDFIWVSYDNFPKLILILLKRAPLVFENTFKNYPTFKNMP